MLPVAVLDEADGETLVVTGVDTEKALTASLDKLGIKPEAVIRVTDY